MSPLAEFTSFIQLLAVTYLACSVATNKKYIDNFTSFRKNINGLPKWARVYEDRTAYIIRKIPLLNLLSQGRIDLINNKDFVDINKNNIKEGIKNLQKIGGKYNNILNKLREIVNDHYENNLQYKKYSYTNHFLFCCFLLLLSSFNKTFFLVPTPIFIIIFTILFVFINYFLLRCKRKRHAGKYFVCDCSFEKCCGWKHTMREYKFYKTIITGFLLVLLLSTIVGIIVNCSLKNQIACLASCIIEKANKCFDLALTGSDLKFYLAATVVVVSMLGFVFDYFHKPRFKEVKKDYRAELSSFDVEFSELQKRTQDLEKRVSQDQLKQIQELLDAFTKDT